MPFPVEPRLSEVVQAPLSSPLSLGSATGSKAGPPLIALLFLREPSASIPGIPLRQPVGQSESKTTERRRQLYGHIARTSPCNERCGGCDTTLPAVESNVHGFSVLHLSKSNIFKQFFFSAVLQNAFRCRTGCPSGCPESLPLVSRHRGVQELKMTGRRPIPTPPFSHYF